MDGDPKILLGAVGISFIGNFINALGLIYQKLGHVRVKKREEQAHHAWQSWKLERDGHMPGKPRVPDNDKSFLKEMGEELQMECMKAREHSFLAEPLWIFGFAIYLVGSLMHVGALGFGSQAILMPLEGVTLAANAVLAPPCLGEELKKRDIAGTAVVIGGITITVLFGPHSSITYTATEMLRMFSKVPFLLWTVGIFVISLVSFCAAWMAKIRNRKNGVEMNGDMDKPGARTICFSYIWIAGVFSSLTMLTAKQTMELVETTFIHGDNQFTTAIPFVIIVNFFMMNFLMEYWKQKALATFSALIVVPLFQVSLVVLSVIGGAIYFDEFIGLAPYRVLMFAFGLLVVCIGIVILASSSISRLERPSRTFFAMTLAIMTGRRLLRRARTRIEMKVREEVLNAEQGAEEEEAAAGVWSVEDGAHDALLQNGASEDAYPPSVPSSPSLDESLLQSNKWGASNDPAISALNNVVSGVGDGVVLRPLRAICSNPDMTPSSERVPEPGKNLLPNMPMLQRKTTNPRPGQGIWSPVISQQDC